MPPFLEEELTLLKFDVNEPYSKARLLPQLLLAKLAVVDQKTLRETCPPANLLAFRILLLWQKILQEPALPLKDMMDEAAAAVEERLVGDENEAVYWLERANSHLIYYEFEKCAECIQRSLALSNLNMELAGRLGKRTRFQQQDIAQLVLKTGSTLSMTDVSDDTDVPTNSLLARCDLERTKKRRVERACAQSELICKLMDGVDDDWKRCELVLASGLEPFWIATCVHAETLQSLGCVSEALLLYEKLEMWDSVISCFKSLGQLEKAEALIRRLLDERPKDSMLICYLGDITMESSYYEKAIEMSGDRNARARKALGNLMLLRNQFETAHEHLRRSLELQPIQLGVWFNAGFCAWKVERYSDAVTCFHRCVSLEPEHFEAWNNLSAAYVKLGQKDRARRILQEALKFNFEHPKVWENYLLLCVDTAEFDQAIKAFHRLLDLNKQQKDDEVLEIITRNVLKMGETVTSGGGKRDISAHMY
ncbi:unnamed protein product [Nippostrongylus brasiliensis]|uniref:Tetratricopeptide repeat protein 27 (inferred by orthology to a human protein) n=1 Tax=Nippostrongylus brasiliensis TaxID=27835 RepID=A0A0N4Y2X9_NIPBR|nr:unnamed protein product [Nippostrongylus brasiliensis]